ncbi:MAG: hypothetical protein J6A38_05370 [Clostridia bacterium]|nr:hypothetical protein [Clostridia bacterium]
MLPEVRKIKTLDVFTPQKWQTFLLRNYGLVTNAKLAEVLSTDEKTVEREVKRLGLDGIRYTERWMQSGYITILRNNWHLLPYEQIMTLLNMTEAELEYNLKEDDFLDVKLGNFKPYAETLTYAPLTEAEIAQTEKIAEIIKENFIPDYTLPFEFAYDKGLPAIQTVPTEDGDFLKIIYGYSMLYGDTLLTGEDPISEGLLKKLSAVGVNGIWFQGVLPKLAHYPFAEGVSNGYEIRRANLNKLIEKCGKYGIKIYLYMNEPRALYPEQFTKETNDLKGWFLNGQYNLCTSTKTVQDYLYTAVKDFVSAVPGLGGIITITMSENFTNCYSWQGCTCPRCLKRSIADVVPEVNNIFMRAIRDSGSSARLIANLWGWAPYRGWTPEEITKGIENLDKDITVLCISEMGTIERDGKEFNVGEYSLSKVGPCKETKKNLSYARSLGHKIVAKVQINNSWEFSIVPYVPVFELIKEHISNLTEFGVTGLMMSWTLGGYPSPSLDLVDRLLRGKLDYDAWLEERYGQAWKVAKEAVHLFSEGYRYYPFDLNSLYNGAQHVGSTNIWYKKRTGLDATMVCYPYDAIEQWKTCSDEEYENCLERLLAHFERGLELLDTVTRNEALEELRRMAETVYVNLRSELVQFRYTKIKETASYQDVRALIEEERSLTKRLYRLASVDARIGYEASNHYFFTQNSFLEKLVNLAVLEQAFAK